jgi:hypothetical protein
VGRIGNPRPIGNRLPRYRSTGQADYQSAAEWHPAPQSSRAATSFAGDKIASATNSSRAATKFRCSSSKSLAAGAGGAAIAPGTAVSSAPVSARTAGAAIIAPIALGRRRRRVGQRRHTSGIDHDVPEGPAAGALTAQFVLVAQRNVKHAALAAVHRIEAEGRARVLDLFGGGTGADAQLFDAQSTVVVGIEGNARMIAKSRSNLLAATTWRRNCSILGPVS